MKLKEAVNHYLLVDRAESTRTMYRSLLTRFADIVGPARALDRITPELLDEWLYDLRHVGTKYEDHPSRPAEEDGLSEATIYKRVKTIKTFFNWCVKREYLAQSPARFLSVPRPSGNPGGKAISEEELGHLLGAARYHKRDWAIMCLIVQSGCRAGEAAGLKIEDLDLSQLRAWIRDTKTNEPRWIYFERETASALDDYLKSRPETDHTHVFISTRGHGPLTAQSISQMIRRRCEDAGLDRTYGAHSLRHRAALSLFRQGEDPRVIQQYLGHKTMQQTWEYGKEVHIREMHRAAGKLRISRSDEPRYKFG